jgi:hypothetical protein
MRARVGVAMETGKQPCEDFDPGSPVGSFLNYHECPGCPGTRRFCANCKSDHHSSGWDTCLAAERAAHAVTRQKLETAEKDLARLKWGVVANAGHRTTGQRMVRWAHVMDATGYGSTSAAELCTEAGFDPHEKVGADDAG